jgi:aldehyde dehydrogenase (NAD+)
VHIHDRLFIDGAWVRSPAPAAIQVVNPATEQQLGEIPAANVADVHRAVCAARAALPGWSATTVQQRAHYLEHLQASLLERMDELGQVIACDVGMPRAIATVVQVGAAAMIMGAYAEVARGLALEEHVANSRVMREPVGVVAAITPCSYPLTEAASKIAPALLAGCTVILKPSEITPLAPFILAELIADTNLPPGVFNLLSGGPDSGACLADHPDVDMVSFTGSTAAGRVVAQTAARSIKRQLLQLGGKSACVILDDADLESAVRAGMLQCFMNSGQTCVAWSRMLVPRHRHADATCIARAVAEELVVGDPLDEDVNLGPVVSAGQRERVRGHIRQGLDDGARLVAGGVEPPAGLERGYYIRPTVLADVSSGMRLAQEEIFGPVLAILPYRDETEAIHVANDTIYGLHAAVFSSDACRAMHVARQLRVGSVDINGAGPNLLAPVGGWKQSGYGRELGVAGLHAYLELKSIQA